MVYLGVVMVIIIIMMVFILGVDLVEALQQFQHKTFFRQVFLRLISLNYLRSLQEGVEEHIIVRRELLLNLLLYNINLKVIVVLTVVEMGEHQMAAMVQDQTLD